MAPRSAIIAGLCGAISMVSAGPAAAQQATALSQAPTLTNERYQEDWAFLADPASKTGRWTEPFKYIPLDTTGDTYLTSGVELRARYEGVENPLWGSAPDQSYIWYRAVPHADLHVGRLRAFVQPVFATVSGSRPVSRAIDRTGFDTLQAFFGAEFDLSDNVLLRVSAGRQLISLGAGRFVDARYGPNVQQAFDGVRTTIESKGSRLTLLYTHPVENRPGDFDDRTSPNKLLWGAYGTQWLNAEMSEGLDLYYLGFRDRDARQHEGRGRTLVHSFGARAFGSRDNFYWNVEGAVQRGRFDVQPVAAWGVAVEVGYRMPRVRFQPDINLIFDVVSGDKQTGDGRIEGLNPMFPRGKYFGALTAVGPRNIVHLHPSITLNVRRNIAVSIAAIAYWRQSRGDGIYSVSGALLRADGSSSARHVGRQVEAAASLQVSPELNLAASLSLFDPGPFIRENGPERPMKMIGLASNFRF